MSIRVKVYTWPPGGTTLAINELNLEMFELPGPGSRYWHDRWGYRVRNVGATEDPPVVHLEHDPDWESQLYEGLPDGYILDGGRRDDDGTWHFALQTPQGRMGGAFFNSDLDAAIAGAIAAAHEHVGRTS